jgi:hypothetical protein
MNARRSRSSCGGSRRGGELQLAGIVDLFVSALRASAHALGIPAFGDGGVRDFNVEFLAQHGGGF